MKKILVFFLMLPFLSISAQQGWSELFNKKLSNALFTEGVWTYENGILTASEDQAIWSSKVYQDFELELEFKNAEGTNSGVIIFCSDIKNWVPNSLEVQIADDHSPKWAESPKTWQCGAIFGRLAASKSVVKKPGDWNGFRIIARDRLVTVILNGEVVTQMDMRKWTEVKKNPDGSDIPAWLNKPAAFLPNYGHIGLQGKHAGAPIYFRNLKVREL